jgi:hypothetical protein
MYCSNCGTKASGNFCFACGARLISAEDAPSPASGQPDPSDQAEKPADERVLRHDWQHEIRYDVLLHVSEVRDLIARHAAQSRKTMTGEQFLSLCDKAFQPLAGVSLSTVVSIAAPIYSRLGIRTGKAHSEVIAKPAGKALVAALCSLARHGRQLKQVHQAQDGCVVEATLPSDLWSLEGELVISVRRHGPGTFIEATTKIPGQLYDWGKSKQCLQQLFEDVKMLVV